MTCQEVVEFLRSYVANELSDAERTVFERHLRGCQECVAYIDSYRSTVRLAKSAKADDAATPVPEKLVAAILAAKAKETC